MDQPGGVERVAAVVVGLTKTIVRRLPASWRKRLDDRLFGAIFQATRVTNDAYGWSPPPSPPDKGPLPPAQP